MTTTNKWIQTNGLIEMTVCSKCGQPYREGHINCTCDSNHPEPCTRYTYDELLEAHYHLQDALERKSEQIEDLQLTLENSRRIAGENAEYANQAWLALQAIEDIVNMVPGDADYGFWWTKIRDIARKENKLK